MSTRRTALWSLLGLPLSGCGGGSGGATDALAGQIQTRELTARSNDTSYPLNIYLPPDNGSSHATLPVVYLLDGASRFQTMVNIVETAGKRVIIVGIGNEALRGRDYVPVNLCTPGGGGHGAFFSFISAELIPYIEAQIGGDPRRRVLLGHSHGGSFVLYALFNEAPTSRRFSAYLASDASIGCLNTAIDEWEAAYAAAYTTLPVRVHISYGDNLANVGFAMRFSERRYTGLALAVQAYSGGHIGMIPQAFADALAFALA